MITAKDRADRRSRSRRQDERRAGPVPTAPKLIPAIAAFADDPFAHVKAPWPAASSAELAECACPAFCERDHDND